MRPSQKAFLFLLFAGTAWWRVSVGSPVPAGPVLSPRLITLPLPPAGWMVGQEKELTDRSGSTIKKAVYKAPDGTELTVQKCIAWADRRNLPLSFYPDDCSFLGTGWEFTVRGAEDMVGPDLKAHRIEVHREKERLVLLSAYSCKGKATGSWHEFKMELIWQRVRRERVLWAKSLVVCPPSGEARKAAGQMLLATVGAPLLR